MLIYLFILTRLKYLGAREPHLFCILWHTIRVRLLAKHRMPARVYIPFITDTNRADRTSREYPSRRKHSTEGDEGVGA